MDASSLGDEDAGGGEVERRAVEVEAVAGGDDEGDDAARDAERLHGLHRAWERCLAGGGGESDGRGLGYGCEEAAYGHAEEKRCGQQHEKTEASERTVDSKQELSQV